MKRKKKLPKYQLGNGSIDIKSPTTLWGWNQNANIDMLPPQNREGIIMSNQQNTPITEDLQQQTQMDKSYSFGFNPVAYAGLTGINQFLSGLGSRKEESKYKQSLIDNGNSAIPFANNFSSGVKYGYQKGGRAPKIYTDRKQFEQAQRMYNDSLLSHKYGEDWFNVLKYKNFNVTEAEANAIRKGIIAKHPGIYDSKTMNNPISSYTYNIQGVGDIGSYRFKKPVQPVVYQPQGTQTQPYKKTISSIHQMTHPIQKMDRIPNQYQEPYDTDFNSFNRKKSGYSQILNDNNYKRLLDHPLDLKYYNDNKNKGNLVFTPFKDTPELTHSNNLYRFEGSTMSNEFDKEGEVTEAIHDLSFIPKNTINIQGQQVPFPQFQVPQQKGNPVYGPGNTIIGYSDNMNFKPAYQYTGAPNNQLNLQDKALLADPEALKKYVLSRDNYKFPTEEFQQGGFSDPGHEEIINNGYPASIPTNRYVTENPNDPTYNRLNQDWQSGLQRTYNPLSQRSFDDKSKFMEENKPKFINDLRNRISNEDINSDSGFEIHNDVLTQAGYQGRRAWNINDITRYSDDLNRINENPNFYNPYLKYNLRNDLYKDDELLYKDNDTDKFTGITQSQLDLPIPMLRQDKPKLGMNSMSTIPLGLNNEQSIITGIPTSMKPGNASLDFRERSNSQMNSMSTTPSILESFKARMKGLPTNMTSGNATLNLSDETPSPVRQSMESMTTGNYPFNKDNNVSFNPQAQSYPTVKNSITAINPTNYRPSSQQANITGTPVIPNTKPININLSETEDPIVRDNKTMSSINPSPYPFTKSGTSQITGNMQEYPKQKMGMTAMSSAPYSSNNPANIKGVQTNMQIPTVQQPSYTTHPIEVYDKRGKFLRKEFIGNDKGIVDHKYIGRHHYAPRGGNSYIDTSYKIGGSFQDYLRQQNKPITENPSTLYQQPTIDEVKKQQALTKQSALYDKTFSKTPLATPASKAKSAQLKRKFVAENPYAKLNDKGEIEAVSPERDLQGNPYNYTQAWRNDDGFKNITNGLETAMLVEGAAHLGVKGLNYAGKRLFGKSLPVQPIPPQKGLIDYIDKEKTAGYTNGNYGYPTQVSGAGMDVYPNTPNQFLNKDYSSFGNMESGVVNNVTRPIRSTDDLINEAFGTTTPSTPTLPTAPFVIGDEISQPINSITQAKFLPKEEFTRLQQVVRDNPSYISEHNINAPTGATWDFLQSSTPQGFRNRLSTATTANTAEPVAISMPGYTQNMNELRQAHMLDDEQFNNIQKAIRENPSFLQQRNIAYNTPMMEDFLNSSSRRNFYERLSKATYSLTPTNTHNPLNLSGIVGSNTKSTLLGKAVTGIENTVNKINKNIKKLDEKAGNYFNKNKEIETDKFIEDVNTELNKGVGIKKAEIPIKVELMPSTSKDNKFLKVYLDPDKNGKFIQTGAIQLNNEIGNKKKLSSQLRAFFNTPIAELGKPKSRGLVKVGDFPTQRVGMSTELPSSINVTGIGGELGESIKRAIKKQDINADLFSSTTHTDKGATRYLHEYLNGRKKLVDAGWNSHWLIEADKVKAAYPNGLSKEELKLLMEKNTDLKLPFGAKFKYKKGGEIENPYVSNFKGGGQNPAKIYTDRKQFEQAQRMYNDSLTLYKSYDFHKNNYKAGYEDWLKEVSKSYPGGYTALKKARESNIGKPLEKQFFDKESKKSDFYTKVKDSDYDHLYPSEKPIINYYKSLIGNSKDFRIGNHNSPDLWHKTINPIGSYYDGASSPIYKKPVQPVAYQSHPIQKMNRLSFSPQGNSQVNIQGIPLDVQPMTLPQQKGTPVYGPGNTIVGYSDNMNFKPAYQYTGAPNNSMNLQDKELLNNPEALKKYIQRKDNYKFPAQEFQKGGSFNYDFLLEDDEDENQYNKNEAENNDRVTEEDVQEEVAKQSRKLADMEFLFGSNKVRKDRDVNRFDDDYVAPDSSSDGTDWASKFKSAEDPNSKFDHGNGAYGSFGFRETGHLAEAYKSPEFREIREQFGDYNSFWNSFKQSGYGPLSKIVDSRYEDWLKRQTGNNISIAGKFNLTGSKSPSSNWMVGNNIPWQGYVNKLNKYKTGGTYSVDNEEIANLIQKGVKFKFV